MGIFPSHRPTSIAPHLAVGAEGERIAERYLRGEGYRILHRNVRVGRDEIDLITRDRDDDVLVFVEVKARARKDEAFPASVQATHRKLAKIRRAAYRWLDERELDVPIRFDVVCVEAGAVTEHWKEVGYDDV